VKGEREGKKGIAGRARTGETTTFSLGIDQHRPSAASVASVGALIKERMWGFRYYAPSCCDGSRWQWLAWQGKKGPMRWLMEMPVSVQTLPNSLTVLDPQHHAHTRVHRRLIKQTFKHARKAGVHPLLPSFLQAILPTHDDTTSARPMPNNNAAAPISQPPCATWSSSSRLSTTRRRRRLSSPHGKGETMPFRTLNHPVPPSPSPLSCLPLACHRAACFTPSLMRIPSPSLTTYIHTASPPPLLLLLLLLLPLLLFLQSPSPNVMAFPVTARLQHQQQQRRLSISLSSSSSISTPPSSLPPSPSLVASAPTIAFPGGGIYFYWQAGAVHYLQQHFNLRQANLIGASAGALTAA